MPGFKFELSQLVNVPGLKGVQGRICGRTEFIDGPNGGESQYFVCWLDEQMNKCIQTFGETELAGHQKSLSDVFNDFHEKVRKSIATLEERGAIKPARPRRKRPTRKPTSRRNRKSKRKARAG